MTRLLRSAALMAFTAVGLTLLGSSLDGADDPPKAKQDLKKEQKAKLRKEALAKKAAEAAKAEEEARKAAEAAKAESAKKAAAAKPAPKPLGPSLNPDAVARLIDTQIAKLLTEQKVPAAAVASDGEFLRRVYLDLTGVIPTAEKARAFVDSTDPDKRAKLVDELLSSPEYGKRQADLWVPKLFPRDSANRFVLKEPLVKWFTEQFNQNTPWDKFVAQLVTATGTVEDNPAVTYFLANRSVDRLTDTATQHFLGIQLQCAQCHNHPFTGWKQTEYWGMAAFFSKVNPQNPKNANKGGDNTKIGVTEGAGRTRLRDFFPESAKTVPAKFLGAEEPPLSDREPYRPVLAKWMTSAENPYFAKAMVNRTWALLFGVGFVNPIDDMHEDNPPSHPELLDALAHQFAASGFDVKQLVRGICLSQAYQRSSKPVSGGDMENDQKLFGRMTVKVMTPEQLYDSLNQVSGPAAAGRPRPAQTAQRPQGANARDQFVQFFLAGAEEANTTDYEAGIPQALRLMNNARFNGAAATRQFVRAGAKPAQVIEEMYLATLSRRPTADELTRLTAFVGAGGADAYGDVLWAILNSSEFTMVR